MNHQEQFNPLSLSKILQQLEYATPRWSFGELPLGRLLSWFFTEELFAVFSQYSNQLQQLYLGKLQSILEIDFQQHYY